MKKVIVLLFSLFLSGNIMAQIMWLDNYDAALSVANKSDKLILIDFWAIWCRPCLVMDDKLWGLPEMKDLTDNFVCLRINVDFESRLVSLFNVTSIPRVILITTGGEKIWDKMGFMEEEPYLAVFRSIPGDIGDLNKKSIAQAENRKDVQVNFSLGIEFQHAGKNIANSELKSNFLRCGAKYLTRAQNLCKDPALTEEIELFSVLNDIYAGREQKALKTIEKMNPVPGNENLAELRHFVLAECYSSIGDKDNFLKHKQMIRKPELLGQLEF